MYPARFEYVAPASLDEVLALKAERGDEPAETAAPPPPPSPPAARPGPAIRLLRALLRSIGRLLRRRR
jgi:hypothetical protein